MFCDNKSEINLNKANTKKKLLIDGNDHHVRKCKCDRQINTINK